MFLYHLETLLGKEKFNGFIPHYFTTYKQKSVDSYEFKATLLDFFANDAEASQKLNNLDWDTWFYKPGFPPKPSFDTELADQCYDLADEWQSLNNGKSDSFQPNSKDIEHFTANQSVVFLERLQSLPKDDRLSSDLIEKMGKTYGYASSKNIELVSRYYVLGLMSETKSLYQPAAALAGQVGRMKFVRPLYRQLIRCDPSLAKETFENNKDFYHPICRGMIERLFEKTAEA